MRGTLGCSATCHYQLANQYCLQEFQAYRHEDRLVICTGSATGAYSSVAEKPVPSFALLDIDGSKVGGPVQTLMHASRARCRSYCQASGAWRRKSWHDVLHAYPWPQRMLRVMLFCSPPVQATVYVYQLIDGQVKVDKLEFNKPASAAGGTRQL